MAASQASSFYYAPSLWGNAFVAPATSSSSSSSKSSSYPPASSSSSSFAYPPTPPIDMKLDHQSSSSSSAAAAIDGTNGVETAFASGDTSSSSLAPLPAISTLDQAVRQATSSDSAGLMMSSLAAFPATAAAPYATVGVASAGGAAVRKLQQEGTADCGVSAGVGVCAGVDNDLASSMSSSTSSSTAYPYFINHQSSSNSSSSVATAAMNCGGDLSSPLYGSYSTTGVFSAKTLQPSRPRSNNKSRANAGKTEPSFVVTFDAWHDLLPLLLPRGFGGGSLLHQTHTTISCTLRCS